MQIGIGDHVVAGELRGEVVVMAIGCQPIGNVVVRNKVTGKFSSLTRSRGRALVPDYSELEVVELERRPNPAPRSPGPVALATLLVIALLAVVPTRPLFSLPRRGLLAVLSDAACAAARSASGYLSREFVRQWWLGAVTLVPCGLFLWRVLDR